MEKTLGERIEKRIAELGISKAEYGRRLGLTSSHLNGLVKSKITLPRADLRRRLANDLGIAHLDLLVIAGELLPDEIPEAGAPVEPFPPGDERREVLELLQKIKPHEDRIVGLKGTLAGWREADERQAARKEPGDQPSS